MNNIPSITLVHLDLVPNLVVLHIPVHGFYSGRRQVIGDHLSVDSVSQEQVDRTRTSIL